MIASFSDFLASIAVMLPAFLISLSFHEFAHALTATFFGDDTAKRAGRLTLNPVAHIDFLGLVFLLLFHFGWAKPVPFNYDNFKHPRLYAVLTALAGPFANFILAIMVFYVIRYFPISMFPPAVTITFMKIFTVTAYVNIMLGVFNLLPIPPLDGSHVITVMFMYKYPHILAWFYQYSIFVLLLLFTLPPVRIFFMYSIMYAEKVLKLVVF